MLTIRKRGKTFHADLVQGNVHLVRGSLGTRNREAARRLVHKIETALSEGALSPLWEEVQQLIPGETYERFSSFAGVQHRTLPTWADLRRVFDTFAEQRIRIGKLAQSTLERYTQTFRTFDEFLIRKRVTPLRDITVPLVEEFKVCRTEAIKKRKSSRGGTGLILDVAILHRIFSFAMKRELVQKNPVYFEGRPGENPEGGAEPFEPEEVVALREHAGADQLSFLVLRWTGLRGSDAVSFTYSEIDFRTREIEHLTRKRKKKVVLPVHAELLFALEVERDRRNAKGSDRVLLHPGTGKPMTRPRLYQRMLALGRRAGIANVRPHRFRDVRR